MKEKTSKILSRIAGIASIVILCIVLVLTISIISSSKKGYTSIFGNAYVVVKSNSMNGEFSTAKNIEGDGKYSEDFEYEKNGFAKGDIIKVKILSESEKENLKVGDIVTFKTILNGTEVLNTHRIVSKTGEGDNLSFGTKGDNALGNDGYTSVQNIVGQYNGGKATGIGNVFLFIHSSLGYLLCIVLPTALILIYCLFSVIKNVNANNKQKFATEKAKLAEEYALEKEKLKQELLKEINAERSANNIDIKNDKELTEKK